MIIEFNESESNIIRNLEEKQEFKNSNYRVKRQGDFVHVNMGQEGDAFSAMFQSSGFGFKFPAEKLKEQGNIRVKL